MAVCNPRSYSSALLLSYNTIGSIGEATLSLGWVPHNMPQRTPFQFSISPTLSNFFYKTQLLAETGLRSSLISRNAETLVLLLGDQLVMLDYPGCCYQLGSHFTMNLNARKEKRGGEEKGAEDRVNYPRVLGAHIHSSLAVPWYPTFALALPINWLYWV